MDSKILGLTVEMNFLREMSKEHKFSSYEKAFVFNDSDNHVWLSSGNLVVTNQNCGFLFNVTDDKNYTVYYLDKEYQDVTKEITSLNKKIKEGTINPLSDVALKVENGVVTNSNNSMMYCFELDMQFSCNAMESEGLGKRTFAVDVNSYEYMKNYYFDQLGYTEFHFVAQAVLTLGGGFDFDEETGRFTYGSVKYIPNLKKAPNSRGEKVEKFTYCAPQDIGKISNLDADWIDGLKYMVSVLKEQKPIPTVFYEKTIPLSLEKAIKICEQAIANSENKSVKKAKQKM